MRTTISSAVKNFCYSNFTGPRLIFTLLFYPLHAAVFAYGWWSQETNTKLAALNGLKFSVWTSRGAGLVLALDGGLILLPVLRNIITKIRPALSRVISVDENIWFHKQVAYQLLFWTIAHVTAHYVNFINVERTQVRPEAAWQIHYTQAGGITGHTMLLLMLLIYTSASFRIRRLNYEIFYFTHHLTFLFFICLYTHATGCFVRDSAQPDFTYTFPFYSTEHCLGYESWRFLIWAGLLYFGERCYRFWRSRRPTEITKVLLHPSGAMEIRFLKPSMNYKSGQWIFIQVPEVSRWQWLPFTISSAPSDPYIAITIRQVGDFTKALGTRLGAGDEVVRSLNQTAGIGKDAKLDEYTVADEEKVFGLGSNGKRGEFVQVGVAIGEKLPLFRVDGPYGAPAEDVFTADVAVLIGAGIGVTPFASILKHIWYEQQKGNLGKLKRVVFVWICKDTGSFGWFQNLLESLEESQSDPNFLHMNIYLTQKLNQDAMYNIALNSGEYDPLTHLRTQTRFGRPDFHAVFDKLNEAVLSPQYLPGKEASLKPHVGVFFCGAGPLAKTIKKEAMSHNSSSVRWTFDKEHF